MKAIAIIEVPEGGKGKWYIDGEIRYTENKSLMMKFDVEMIPLKPLPSKLVPFGYLDAGNEDGLYEKGYNDCIDEITGETE